LNHPRGTIEPEKSQVAQEYGLLPADAQQQQLFFFNLGQ